LLHETAKAFPIYLVTHSAARMKLTSMRTSALYREWAES
jgi:hypothetical protein